MPRVKGFDYSIWRILKEVQICFFYTWTLCSCPIWTFKPFTFAYRTKWWKTTLSHHQGSILKMVSKSSPPFRRCQMCVCQESVVRPFGPKKELYSLQTSKGFGLCFLNRTLNIPKHCVKRYLERLGTNVFNFRYNCCLYFLHATTRWAPGCKRSYDHYKWPYKGDLKWVTGVITLLYF